jgi:hypothetical protein
MDTRNRGSGCFNRFDPPEPPLEPPDRAQARQITVCNVALLQLAVYREFCCIDWCIERE